MPDYSIDYERIVARWSTDGEDRAVVEESDLPAYHAFLAEQLSSVWCAVYEEMPNDGVEIVEFDDHGFRFLFDLASERVVAAFGVSAPSHEPRDASRMAGFLAGSGRRRAGHDPLDTSKLAKLGFRDRFLQLRGDSYDRGHFISHKQGGGLDVNLFPQRSSINQGRSALGREYRAMERRCADRPGVFCFSRPVYRERTWVPSEFDYGLSEHVGELEVRTFPN